MVLDNQIKKFDVSALYHFTDVRNLPSIRNHGGLFSLKELKEQSIVVEAPGGNQLSQDLARHHCIDDFISLCFRPSHPMEFVAKQRNSIERSIFIPVSPSILNCKGVCFCNGISNSNDSEITPIADAASCIDFEVLYTRTDWTDPAIQARLQNAEKCEILVPTHIPIKFLTLPRI